MQTIPFHPRNVIQRLVTHYGLPAFLFEATGDSTIRVQQAVTIVLVPYAAYSAIAQLEPRTGQMFLFEDLWRSKEIIMASQIARQAGYHDKLSARAGRVLRIEKKEADFFLERYHLMGSAQAATHYGLVHDKQLVAVATFSKGRKMDRLPQGSLSYELIRLASLPGLTVTGNLSRFIRQFHRDHQAGDVMTYVDALLGDKRSFEKNGFVLHGMSKPVQLWVDTHTHQRYFRDPGNRQGILSFYNTGNYKLVKTFEQV